jgi:hypothetical protein
MRLRLVTHEATEVDSADELAEGPDSLGLLTGIRLSIH